MEKKQITLSIDLPPNLPPLAADLMRLEQVLNNLLENALKYTEANGEIRIRAASSQGAIELRVEDTGIGIPPADLPHIFERFYRADKARSRERGGTGLASPSSNTSCNPTAAASPRKANTASARQSF